MKYFSYLIYFSLYSFMSYKTNFGFEYSNGFELLWGSLLSAFISGIIANIIFYISYDLTGWLSILCDCTKTERKSLHWKFRLVFSFFVFIFTVTPFCSMIMTPLVNITYTFFLAHYNNLIDDIKFQILDTFK